MKRKILKFSISAFILAFICINSYVSINTNMNSDIGIDQLINASVAQGQESGSKGTLYGNTAGTKFCCASGSNNCSAASC